MTSSTSTINLRDRLPDTVRHALPDGQNGDVNANPKHKKLYDELRGKINEYPLEKPYNVAIETVPVTIERMPYIPSEKDGLIDAGTARATIVPDKEHPDGTIDADWAARHESQTAVQQHCSFFDQDHDGVIWPSDTYTGCRKIGWNIFLSALATWIINLNLSYPTQPSWVPDPFFRIYLANMHKCKHGSDSMSYDNEGRFRPQNFEDVFAKYDRGNKGGLDRGDLARFHKGQRMAMDFWGWSATALEWLGVWLLVWPADGVLRKDDVRRVLDGSIFEHKAQENAQRQEHAQRMRKCAVNGNHKD
ncbi:Caleosin-domain-containing protein [Xylariomycetidae sp. FL2044]|nr:Caleosin-domain-containing protein [Xylariomycetidae sp. FL2044]